MGHDIMDEFPEVKKIFELVDDICQKPISKLCFEGPQDELTLTVNLQPAITAVNLACLTALHESGIDATISGGHSLGEYSALTSSGIITNENALKLVKKRGELMHRESLSNPGVMTAVLGMGIDALSEIVTRASESGVLAIANHNTAEQIVITGEQESISHAVNLIKETGGKAIPLKVSGAWHCSLMENAVSEFRQYMDDIPFSKPEATMLFNATAESEGDPETIKEIMAQQLTSPVKWYEVILKMLENGAGIFVEVGPKKVLTGLLKKIIPRDSEAKVYNVEDMKSLNLFLEDLSS
jgi:[acyl-carrier-protein] S-malonyltransferase